MPRSSTLQSSNFPRQTFEAHLPHALLALLYRCIRQAVAAHPLSLLPQFDGVAVRCKGKGSVQALMPCKRAVQHAILPTYRGPSRAGSGPARPSRPQAAAPGLLHMLLTGLQLLSTPSPKLAGHQSGLHDHQRPPRLKGWAATGLVPHRAQGSSVEAGPQGKLPALSVRSPGATGEVQEATAWLDQCWISVCAVCGVAAPQRSHRG